MSMAQTLTADDARQSLSAHVEAKGIEVFTLYGPQIGWSALQRLLQDRTQVRYPCEIVFDAAGLQPGEFAHPEPKGANPEDGFTMFVHPLFMTQLDQVPALVLYQLVALNYGVFASSDDAETFGAAALGLTRDEYYDQLCDLSDQLGGGGCSCGGH
ncbi:hypothetical protein SAMN05444173_2891 [Opitutus sp. GAS368]|nr:hypothetical protein SAMN05444173_2891 [Opitutus sp. GAS368]